MLLFTLQLFCNQKGIFAPFGAILQKVFFGKDKKKASKPYGFDAFWWR
jgi:hypothetical protein